MLGKIKKVHLRKVWEHEALNFTPWLAENLEEIGMGRIRPDKNRRI